MGALAARTGGRNALLALAAITLLGLGLRVGYAVDQPYSPPPDSRAYERIADSLEEGGGFDARPDGAAHEVQPSSAYSPGLPLFTAGVYWASGGEHLTLVLVLLAVIGAAAIPLAYLLGRRLAVGAGLVGAGVVAIYPALLQYQGLLLTEPLAATLLVASLVSFFWAADSGGLGRWVTTGALLGLLALVRPEYLPIALLLPLLSLARRPRPLKGVGLSLLATALVLAPWAIHNAVTLDRFVPISTGGGKALYIGTYLDADGDGPELRELLLSERPALHARLAAEGAIDDPSSYALERVLAQVAAERHPDLEVDAALGKLGRSHLEYDLSEEPLRFAGMLVGKGYDTWTEPARGVMRSAPWRALQLALALLSLAGLAVLAAGRQWLEALACGLVLLYMTAVGAVLIASPRRELVVVPVLAALSGVVVASARDSLARRWAS